MLVADRFGAYYDRHVTVPPKGEGALSGLTFAVKDVFAVKGHRNAAGNPDWLRTHEPAAANAHAIDRLLEQGARLSGVTHTDELMYDLNGVNAHYGTPVNPKAPDRIPGGSSSGSAVAVAAGEADFALGTDTGGSVRIPSSYCGIYGFRPSHGAVSAEGVIPLAPSFDTVGWMARYPGTLLAVGRALLPRQPSEPPFGRLLVPEDVWAAAGVSAEALRPFVPAVERAVGPAERVMLAGEGGPERWMDAFRILQGREIWRTHGEWIERTKPEFGGGIAERFRWTATLTEDDRRPAAAVRDRVREQMIELLGRDGLLVIPTAPGPAPRLELAREQLEAFRFKTLLLCCIAGLAGLPQVTLPFGSADGAPVGLSLIAGSGRDLALLELAERLGAARPGA